MADAAIELGSILENKNQLNKAQKYTEIACQVYL